MAYKFNPFTGNFDQVPTKAVELSYDNTGTGLTATDVQNALSELDGIIAALPDPITYQGTWDASTNTPALDNTDTGVTGYLYQVTVAGTVNFGAGAISFEIGDKVVNNGTEWQKWDMTDAVASVNGFTGAVSLDTDDIPEGTALYFTNALAQAAITGAASSITTANLTANRAVVSDGSGKVAVSAVTDTELGYLSGATSNIQTQLNAVAAPSVLSINSDVTLTANRIHLVDTTAARNLTLPAAAANLRLWVKDASGLSETNNITVAPAAGTIDGQATLVISSNYAAKSFVSDGTNWFLI